MYQVIEIKDYDNIEYTMINDCTFNKAIEFLNALRDNESIMYLTFKYNPEYKLHCVNYISRLYTYIPSYIDLVHT